MQLKSTESWTHARLTVNSMRTRLNLVDRQPAYASHLFRMQATSAQTKACSIVSYLNNKVRVRSALVDGSLIARVISDSIDAH